MTKIGLILLSQITKQLRNPNTGGEGVEGFVRRHIEKTEKELKEALMQKRQERINDLLEKSGIGNRFRNKTFANFISTKHNREALLQAKKFCDTFPNVKNGLLITGPVGVGKTHLAAAITNELISKLYTVVCRNITDIVSLIKSTYGGKTDLEEWEIVNILTQETDLLIIDDLGKEKTSDNTNTILYQIINRLNVDEKPIIVTTNYISNSLKIKLGERGEAIVSRLTEMTVPVVMSGEDWRVKQCQ